MAYYYKNQQGSETTFYTDNIIISDIENLIPLETLGRVYFFVRYETVTLAEYFYHGKSSPSLRKLNDEITWGEFLELANKGGLSELEMEFDNIHFKYYPPFQFVLTMPHWRFTDETKKVLLRKYYDWPGLVDALDQNPGEIISCNRKTETFSHRPIPSLKFFLDLDERDKWPNIFKDLSKTKTE